MIKQICLFIFAFLVAFPALAGPADGVVELKVLSGWRTGNGTHMVGFQLRLAPGWKTYWRAPGDGGIPPRFDWQGSQNVATAAFHWPVPEVFDQNGMRSIGYTNILVLPVELSLGVSNAPAQMRGRVQIGVCENICVPVLLDFDALLPVVGTRDPAIVAALLDRPMTEDEADVGVVTCAVDPTTEGLRLTISVDMAQNGANEAVVIEAGDQQVWVSQPQTWREGNTLFARSDMIHVNGGGFALNRSNIRITVLANSKAVDIHGCDAAD
jgi:DsbC/DsbD-like thiol-disulfide interchange protein